MLTNESIPTFFDCFNNMRERRHQTLFDMMPKMAVMALQKFRHANHSMLMIVVVVMQISGLAPVIRQSKTKPVISIIVVIVITSFNTV